MRIQDNGDGSRSIVPDEMDMAEFERLEPVTRHVRVWAVDDVADEPPARPRCLARRLCAGMWFLATGCGRGFAKP